MNLPFQYKKVVNNKNKAGKIEKARKARASTLPPFIINMVLFI